MKITTPNGILEGDSIEAILKKYGTACLLGAYLRYADLRDADLRGANLSELTVAQTSILPDEGDIIGWKKALALDGAPIIVKLLIPSDAKRSNSTGRKCRANKARILDLQDRQGNSLPPDTPRHTVHSTQTSPTKKAKPCTSKTSIPTGGTNAPPASTSSSPASKQSNTRRLQMSNEIQRFEFKGASLRALTDEAGEPWFVAKDACDILGNDTNHLREALDDDEITNLRNSEVWNQPGRAPLIISEPGLYKLIMRSRKPEAKEFQRWVTHEVLPQIRKTGGYIPTTDMDDDMTILAKAVMIGQRTMETQKRRIAEQYEHIKALEPKARFADAVAASDGTCLI